MTEEEIKIELAKHSHVFGALSRRKIDKGPVTSILQTFNTCLLFYSRRVELRKKIVRSNTSLIFSNSEKLQADVDDAFAEYNKLNPLFGLTWKALCLFLPHGFEERFDLVHKHITIFNSYFAAADQITVPFCCPDSQEGSVLASTAFNKTLIQYFEHMVVTVAEILKKEKAV